ncbi:MAG: 2-amino-4-oxopentanoate thiolase subunit OrtA [Clostridia bacterium]
MAKVCDRDAATESGSAGRVRAGEYVQIHTIILKPGERAPQVPEDTQKVPLELRVKGYLDRDAFVGDEVTITTVLGRKVKGRLVEVNPLYPHSFARPVPELLHVGEELWRLLGTRGAGEPGEGEEQ